MDPKTAVQYSVAVQTPQVRINSIQALESTPLMSSTASVVNSGPSDATAASSTRPELLSNLASVTRIKGPTNITHYNIGADRRRCKRTSRAPIWGRSRRRCRSSSPRRRAHLPRGSTIKLTGADAGDERLFTGLGVGIVAAIVLVYLLLVVNFQSWREPLIILMALPGTLAGIVWGLFLTGTTLSVPALMGTLMSIGVADRE